MAFLRKNKPLNDEPIAEELAVPDGVRTDGPWDVSERRTDGDAAYVDLGPLRVRGREGMEIRLQSDGKGDRITAALVVIPDAALELRAFAAPKSPGQWDLVRADILAEVSRLKGEAEELDGVFGTEVRAKVPVQTQDGQSGFQPSRIIGIDGPRWMMRATLLGRAALEPSNEGVLIDTLRDVVVVRGQQAMMAREPLLLTPPQTDVAPGAE